MRGDSDRHELIGGIFGEAAGFGSSGVTAIPASGASTAATEVIFGSGGGFYNSDGGFFGSDGASSAVTEAPSAAAEASSAATVASSATTEVFFSSGGFSLSALVPSAAAREQCGNFCF